MDTTEKKQTIGIGVTTTPNRSYLVDEWLKEFEKVKPENYHLHIYEDFHYKGVAYSKNQNLKSLQGCDYIFLFDDDCYPIKENWTEFFINSKENHLLYLADYHFKLGEIKNIELFKDCGGVFMYFTKETFLKVGYFNPEYSQYGFEHAGLSHRIYRAGLTHSPYQQLKRTKDYLFSYDYQSAIQSSIPDYKKQRLIEENRKTFIKEISSNKIYYNFEA